VHGGFRAALLALPLCAIQVRLAVAPRAAGMVKAMAIAAIAMLDANVRMVGHSL
jgi:hypothetical protein